MLLQILSHCRYMASSHLFPCPCTFASSALYPILRRPPTYLRLTTLHPNMDSTRACSVGGRGVLGVEGAVGGWPTARRHPAALGPFRNRLAMIPSTVIGCDEIEDGGLRRWRGKSRWSCGPKDSKPRDDAKSIPASVNTASGGIVLMMATA